MELREENESIEKILIIKDVVLLSLIGLDINEGIQKTYGIRNVLI